MNTLVHRLRKLPLYVEQQYLLRVHDEDRTEPGEYYADLFIEGCLIVELKAVRAITGEHVAQIPGYLKSSRIETGLPVSFGAPKLYVMKGVMNIG